MSLIFSCYWKLPRTTYWLQTIGYLGFDGCLTSRRLSASSERLVRYFFINVLCGLTHFAVWTKTRPDWNQVAGKQCWKMHPAWVQCVGIYFFTVITASFKGRDTRKYSAWLMEFDAIDLKIWGSTTTVSSHDEIPSLSLPTRHPTVWVIPLYLLWMRTGQMDTDASMSVSWQKWLLCQSRRPGSHPFGTFRPKRLFERSIIQLWLSYRRKVQQRLWAWDTFLLLLLN